MIHGSFVTESCLALGALLTVAHQGSSVHGIFQARILEWVAISFFRGSSGLRNRNLVSALYRLEPWRVQKRRKRRFLLCQKPLRKRKRISQSLRSSAWERSLPKRCFERQGGSLFMKKLSIITRNTGRCTELKFEWLGWHEKLATSMYPWNPNWHLSWGSEASTVWAQRFERCCSYLASGRSSMAHLLSSTRNKLTFWELWSHTLHGGTQIWSL